ncbi:hypothetical protein [Latilactobacillus curvatus]|uniref:hypothetical protein n=1 Tax=Latilactobacillus curvatus TaxID=28038 RepID=UPI003C2C2C05
MTNFNEKMASRTTKFGEDVVALHNDLIKEAKASNPIWLQMVSSNYTNETKRPGEALKHIQAWLRSINHPEFKESMDNRFKLLFNQFSQDARDLNDNSLMGDPIDDKYVKMATEYPNKLSVKNIERVKNLY